MTNSTISRQWTRMRPIGLVLAGIGLGYLAGVAAGPASSARAEVTEEPRREAFKAGGVLNEPVLREISATLLRIETRMERLEKTLIPPAPLKAGTKPIPAKKSSSQQVP